MALIGEGSSFWVELPLAPAPVALPLPEVETGLPQTPPREIGRAHV